MQLVKFKRYRTTETFESAEDVIVNADKVAYLMPGAQADAVSIVLDGTEEIVVFGCLADVARCLLRSPQPELLTHGTTRYFVGLKEVWPEQSPADASGSVAVGVGAVS